MSSKYEYTWSELDALNVMLHWFGGTMNRADAWVASVDVGIIKDLVDEGLVRSNWLSWSITRRGRQALADNNINCFGDTRSF